MYEYKPPRTPRIVGGEGAMARLPALLDEVGARRVFVITSPTASASSEMAKLREILGLRVGGEFTRVERHSPLAVVKQATVEAKRSGCDTLISFGGGSAIDTAKGIVWYWDETAEIAPVRHFAIPSTLSGAEFGVTTGITIDGHKNVHRHTRIVVDVVVLDPAIAAMMPRSFLQASLLNALDHCLEGIVSIARSPMTDAFYLHAIRLLQSSSALDSATTIAQAQAGASLSSMHLVPMGLAHALAHVVGGRYRTPHALTHGLVAAPVMRFNRPVVARQQRLIADVFGIATSDRDDEWAANRAIEAVDDLVHRMGAPVGLRGLGVPEDGLRELAQMAISDRNASTNPRPVGPDEAYQVLRWAWSGELAE